MTVRHGDGEGVGEGTMRVEGVGTGSERWGRRGGRCNSFKRSTSPPTTLFPVQGGGRRCPRGYGKFYQGTVVQHHAATTHKDLQPRNRTQQRHYPPNRGQGCRLQREGSLKLGSPLKGMDRTDATARH